ncbi:MAG: phosphonoacetaldehyde reductase [Lachnospiraceae bacterium]|nr:phosphonoacetaldehyde reductase [Lachnospiraceae bacterium]
MDQRILAGNDQYIELNNWLFGKKTMVVCGRSFSSFGKIKSIIDNHSDIAIFSNYTPNPKYESVIEAVEKFEREKCDSIIAVGGGSAIDVAKCVKLFAHMDRKTDYLEQDITDPQIPFLAIPTTAGTGAEATKFAVIYVDGKKHSITSEYGIPDTVLLDPDNLSNLPLYQRQTTMMDAFAHSIESMWSINSTEESRRYSVRALELIKNNYGGYLNNFRDGCSGMQQAAYIAGKAINISQTTAGHAMCYMITSVFGCSHGHSAMMVNRKLFPWMVSHIDNCIDPRGKNYLEDIFSSIAKTLGCENVNDAIQYIDNLFCELKLEIPKASDYQLDILTESVNLERLKNNPIKLNQDDIKILYKQILGD